MFKTAVKLLAFIVFVVGLASLMPAHKVAADSANCPDNNTVNPGYPPSWWGINTGSATHGFASTQIHTIDSTNSGAPLSDIGFTLHSQRQQADPGYHYPPTGGNDPNAKIYNWGPSGDTAPPTNGGPGSTGRWSEYRFATGTGRGTPGAGGATASSDMYMGTTPNLSQNPEFNCTGWLELGPGVKVLHPGAPDLPKNYVREDGNNFVLDCADDESKTVNGTVVTQTVNNMFWVSNVDTPKTDSTYGGHWSITVYGYNAKGKNSVIYSSSDVRNMANPSANTSNTFGVTNGMNMDIELQWHANPPPKQTANGSCTKLDVGNPILGESTTYTNAGGSHPTAQHVTVTGVTVNHINGNPASGTNIDAYAPSDTGGNGTKTWNYWPNANSIQISTIQTWYKSTNPNKGMHNIPGASRYYLENDGKTWTTTPTTISCFSASCRINWVEGNGPWDGSYNPDGSRHYVVTTGGPIYVHGTFIDNGTPQGPNWMPAGAFLDGPNGTNNLGFVPYSGYSYPFQVTITAPNTVTTYSGATFIPQYNASHDNMSGCTMPPTDVYQHFDASVSATSTLPNPEHPTQGDYYNTSIKVANNSSHNVNIPTASYFYTLTASGVRTNRAYNGQGTFASAPWDNWPYTSWGPGHPTTTLSGHYTIPPGSYQAGDEYCAYIYAAYTAGWVGPSSNVVGAANPQSQTNCPRVVNEPYFKVLNSGIQAGGEFNQCLDSASGGGGLLAGYNDTQSDPAGRIPADRGASAQLSDLALLKITGVASAQTPGNPGILRSPTDLTFANTNPSDITSDNQSPSLGGNFTGCQQLTDETAPSGARAIGGFAAANMASGAYTRNGNLTIVGGNLPINRNVSIFVNGNVYISNNIGYVQSRGWTAGTAPSFVLHATGNIYISPNVTNLAGIYIAKSSGGSGGKIYDCADSSGFAPLQSKYLYYCRNQLVVYGSFIADQVNLMRTYGSLRDEEPTPSSPGRQTVGMCWTSAWYISPACHGAGWRCTMINEPSDPDTWNDNALCVAASSSLRLYWTHCQDYPGCSQSKGSIAADPGLLHLYNIQNGIGTPGGQKYPYCTQWNVPPDYAQTWQDNWLCMNQARSDGTPLLHFVNSPAYDPGTSCTTINESADPQGQWRTPGYFLCQPYSSPVPPKATGPPYGAAAGGPACSNAGAEVDSKSCAAEVFEFSPQMYITNGGGTTCPGGGCGGPLQYQALTSLPPVL